MEQFEFDRPDRVLTMSDDCYQPPERDAFNDQLHALIQAGLPYPPNSPQRRKIRIKLLQKIQQPGKLLQRNSLHYEDALMETWRYFWGNLWEATTATTPFSDPTCKILHRFNKYLKFRLQDAEVAARDELQKRKQSRSIDGEWQDIAEAIPTPEPDEQTKTLRELIATDPTAELRNTHLRFK